MVCWSEFIHLCVHQVLKREFPNGVNIVYESVGGEMFQTCMNSLAVFGRMVLIGMISQVCIFCLHCTYPTWMAILCLYGMCLSCVESTMERSVLSALAVVQFSISSKIWVGWHAWVLCPWSCSGPWKPGSLTLTLFCDWVSLGLNWMTVAELKSQNVCLITCGLFAGLLSINGPLTLLYTHTVDIVYSTLFQIISLMTNVSSK
jgi:hypothetical protein